MQFFSLSRRPLALVLASCAAASGSALSCADEMHVPDDDESFVTTGVNGSTHASGSGAHASTGAWGHGGEGASGAGGSDAGPYPVILAHGFFGFEQFAGVDFATYFFEVKEHLAAHGEPLVFTPAVDPFNDSVTRGAQLEDYIEAVLTQTGQDRVVIIGHSQGGLDARVVAHDRPDLVAAVLTLATPHGGTPVADIALGITEDPDASELVDDLVNLIGAPLYDEIGEETSVSDSLYQFSTPGITAFNAAYPDAPGVFYASLGGRTDGHLGGQVCVPDVVLPTVASWSADGDPTEVLFYIGEMLIDGDGSEPNDGLVRVVDSKHGEFWGCVPADHMDEIGQLFGDGPGYGNPFNHKTLYLGLVQELRSRGF